MNEWINAKERLPYSEYGESRDVLTVDSGGLMRVLYFDGGCWCWPTGELLTTYPRYPITHWMELPDAPGHEE